MPQISHSSEPKFSLWGINGPVLSTDVPDKDRTEGTVDVSGATEQLLDFCKAGIVLFCEGNGEKGLLVYYCLAFSF